VPGGGSRTPDPPLPGGPAQLAQIVAQEALS